MTPGELAGLTVLIDRGQLAKAAEEVRRLWSKAREPALAELLESFPSRALPPNDDDSTRSDHWLRALRDADALLVPALLTELAAILAQDDGTAVVACLRGLALRPGDPRVGAACVRWLLHPAQLRAPSLAIYRELERALKHHLDPRNAEALRGLVRGRNPWAQWIGSGATLRSIEALGRDAESLLFHRRVTPELVQRIGELADRVSTMPVDAAPDTVESVLLRIRSHPDDEGLRAVFRDLLLEANDPWGELIALQESRAKYGGPRTEAETQLLRKIEPRILGSLPLRRPGMVLPLDYGRGFLTHAAIRGHAHEVAAAMEHTELSTLEKVTFYDAAAITPNLLSLKEAHAITLADLERARRLAPEVKLLVVSIKHATAPELALATWWPELKELYTFDLATRLDALLALPVSKQLTAVGMLDRPAATAFDAFEVATLSLAPPSVKRVRLDAFARRGTLRVSWVRTESGWRAEVSEGSLSLPRGDREAAGDLEAALPALKRYLRGARSVAVMHGVSPQIRQAIEQR